MLNSSLRYLTENRFSYIAKLNTTLFIILLVVFLGGSMADLSWLSQAPLVTLGLAQPGTWGGAADIGLTEKIAPPTNNLFNNPLMNQTQYGPSYQGPVGPQSIEPQQSKSIQTPSGAATNTPTSGGQDKNAIFKSMGLGEIAPEGWNPPDTNALFNQINSGWDAYTNQLNSMLGELPGQLSAQQGYAKQSFDTSLNEAANQKQSSERQLGEQQKSSLKDLGSNMKNLFQAGNTYLGNRGAGDSSAANQYAYALTQMGSKARADVMAQVQARQNQIGDIFNSEKNRLQTELTSRMSQLTDWFSNAQSQLRQQLGTAGLNKSKDIQALSQNLYNQAIQAKQQIEAEARAQQNQLQTWAMNNSKSIAELKANLSGIAANNQPFQGLSNPLSTQQQTTTPSLFGGFRRTDEKV